MVSAGRRRSGKRRFHHEHLKQGLVSQLLVDVVGRLKNIHSHGIEGTRYVLAMRYGFA